jgi:hypothetical protein
MAKTGDGDFLRSVAESVLQILMEADVDGLIGAGRHERSGERSTWRNGYRDRSLDTRLGTLNLKIPKLRTGAYFPGFLEPARRWRRRWSALSRRRGSPASARGVSTSWCRRWNVGYLEVIGVQAVQGHRRAGERLPEAPSPASGRIWLDATYLKVREGGRIVSVAAIIAVAVTTEGKREIVGLHIGPSEAEPFWSTFLRDLVRRGLKGVKLVISDAHEGLKAAITGSSGQPQRCRVHFMRNALAHVPKGRTPWWQPRSARSFSSQTMPPPRRPGATSPTSCAPAGQNSAPAWTMPSTTCSPT